MSTLESITPGNSLQSAVSYCHHILNLLIDLESQLPTRRYLNTLLHDHLVVPLSDSSSLASVGRAALASSNPSAPGALFCQLASRLRFYAQFEINVLTGLAITPDQSSLDHYENIEKLQRALFTNFKNVEPLRVFSLDNTAKVDTRESLVDVFSNIDEKILRDVCRLVGIRTKSLSEGKDLDSKLLLSSIVFKYSRRIRHVEIVNATSLYPDEVRLDDLHACRLY